MTARGRAEFAAKVLKKSETLGREYDNCFEMYDGSEVVKHLIEMARKDTELKNAMMGKHRRCTPKAILEAL